MDEISRTREEIVKTLNEAAAQIRDAMVESHIAATLAAAQVEPGMSTKAVVTRYRTILSELRKDGPYQGA